MSAPPASSAIRALVDAREISGAAALAWQGGEVVALTCVGWRDPDARLPIQRDTLFRIASLSKPITSVAALILADEGRLRLEDPLTRWAPELSQVQVLRSPGAALRDTVPARRALTIADLLTQRAGLSYSDFLEGPLAAAYREALGAHIDSIHSPDEWIARLATLPLLDQPGEAFRYGHATDLLGLILARAEDMPLGEVLQRRVFGPLGMVDTGFVVPEAERARRAACCGLRRGGTRRDPARTSPGDTRCLSARRE